ATGVTAHAGVTGTDLNFTASIGPFSVFVVGGTGSLSGDIALKLNDTAADHRLTVFDGSLKLPGASAFDTNLKEILKRSASVNLPLYVGSQNAPIPIGNPNAFTIDIPDIEKLLFEHASPTVGLPNFDLFKNPPSIFQLLANPSVVVDGLDSVLKTLEDAVGGEILGIKIPFLGDALANNPATQFIENIRDNILAPLSNTLRANNVTLDGLIGLVQDQIYSVLHNIGGTGIDLFGPNDTGDSKTTVQRHGFGTNDPNANNFVAFDVALGHKAIITTGVNFDLGIPALSLSANLHPTITFEWHLHFGFGVDTKQGFYFVADPSAIGITITVDFGSQTSGVAATADGQIVFLSLSLKDEQHDFSGLDPADTGSHYSQVQLSGNVALHSSTQLIDPATGKPLPNPFDHSPTPGPETILTIHHFRGAKLTDIVQPSLHGDADLAAQIRVDFSGIANQVNLPDLANILPAVQADLIAHWDLSLDLKGPHFGDPFLAFENISLDVGSFISTFVGPILTEIHNILSPLDWLIGPSGLLNMRVPLLSDLAGKTITVVDLIPLFDPDDGPTIVKFVKAIQQLDYLSGLVAQATADAHAGRVLSTFGSIPISNPGHKPDKGFGTSFLGGSLIKGGGLSSLTSLSGASVPDSLPDSGNMTGNGADGSVESFMSALSGSSASGLSFPILKPASI